MVISTGDRELRGRVARRFLAVFLTVVAHAPAGEPPLTGTLSGTIVGSEGKPVVGARVSIYTRSAKPGGKPTLTESKTDSLGRFRLGPLDPVYRHPADLIVEAENYARLSTLGGEVSVYPGRDVDLGALRLERGRVFTGRIIDFDGKPRPNMAVTPQVYRHYLGHTVTDIGSGQQVATDSDGRFRTSPLPVATLALVVQAPERQLAHLGRPIQPGGEEDLGEIRLEKDVPVEGEVQDENGEPIAGATIGGMVGHDATTDERGRFAVRGFGPNPSFQLNVSKAGYAPVISQVRVSPDGVRYVKTDADPKDATPAKQLIVVLKRAGVIEGSAVDAGTGEPVHLSRIVVCNFERKSNGEVVLRGCRSDGFEEPEAGRFRVHFPVPDEYHLTFSAEGYHDAEAFTPKVKDLKTIRGIVARMKKKTAGSSPDIAKQTISGKATRDGRPIAVGWAGLWVVARTAVAANTPVMRGRTVVGGPIVYSSAPICDGSYTLDVPFQNEAWFVVVEEPGHALTQVGPIPIALNDHKKLDISAVEGGHVRGRVTGVPAAWAGHAWVVAFSKAAVRVETCASPDGTFSLPILPPGEYGLKVGHEAYEDAEVYPGTLFREHPESFTKRADPWQRAVRVKVESGGISDGVEVEFPR